MADKTPPFHLPMVDKRGMMTSHWMEFFSSASGDRPLPPGVTPNPDGTLPDLDAEAQQKWDETHVGSGYGVTNDRADDTAAENDPGPGEAPPTAPPVGAPPHAGGGGDPQPTHGNDGDHGHQSGGSGGAGSETHGGGSGGSPGKSAEAPGHGGEGHGQGHKDG